MGEERAGACPVDSGGRMQDCAAYPACACDHLALTNAKFAGYAARLAQKSATWAADTMMTFIDLPDEAIQREVAMRFIREMRGLLDHVEKQVRP